MKRVLIVLGGFVLGFPIFWMLLTSFKEDADMSSLVWAPKVTETRPAFDPRRPLYEATVEGQTLKVEPMGTTPDGMRVRIVEPEWRRGQSAVVSRYALHEIPRSLALVQTTLNGRIVNGLLAEDRDSQARIILLSPTGGEIRVPSDSVQPVRHLGLYGGNYKEALDDLPPEAHHGLTYLLNSLLLCALNIAATLASCCLVAYGFARFRFPGRDTLFLILLGTMMLPSAVTLLPTFMIFRSLGWMDTFLPLWAPALTGNAFTIFLLRQFFRTIPTDIEDAAWIDGCGRWRTLVRIILPQMKPALAVVSIWTFVATWNNFMGPLLYVSSPEHMTVSYAMQLFAGDKSTDPGPVMALATLSLIPIAILFIACQRAFMRGLSLREGRAK
jgi:multiple sugar transport system permease protein